MKTPITPRQTEVLKALSSGKTDKEIASDLGISINTVGTHVAQILIRLRCKSRTHAAVKFLNR